MCFNGSCELSELDVRTRVANRTQPFLITFLVLQIRAMSISSSKDTVDQLADDRPSLWHLQYEVYVGDQMYRTALTLIKTSIVIFYLRVFRVYRTWWRMALWFAFFMLWVWYIAFSAMALFRCRPISRAWKIPGPSGQCLRSQPITLASRITDVVMDVWILILPIPMLWGLQMRLLRKVGITAVFILGYR